MSIRVVQSGFIIVVGVKTNRGKKWKTKKERKKEKEDT